MEKKLHLVVLIMLWTIRTQCPYS